MNIFFDGYNIKEDKLDNQDKIIEFLNILNSNFFNNKGKITIVPYFNGKVKRMGGISATILGDNFHFTCHTFCYLETVFIDYYGNDINEENLIKMILNFFPTSDYDLCKDNNGIKGKFGKQIIITCEESLNFNNGKSVINNILKSIEMTPIYDLLTNYKNEEDFDLLQLIAESHIAIHKKEQYVRIDVFSCKDFDESKIFKLLKNNSNNLEIVNRGIYFSFE
jgi:S-adenosylmethionine/arginine decarboxylase-like enzyme